MQQLIEPDRGTGMPSPSSLEPPPPSLATSAPAGVNAAAARPAARRRWWPWVLVVGAGIGALYLLFPWVTLGQAKSPAAASGRASATGRGVPVVVGTARAGNMEVYLTGLGTVTSFDTVTVRSRVDGQLVEVAFEEGQMVHEGDLLARLDPRPFEVQLTGALGQKAKDEATLKNAQLDLVRYQDLVERGIAPKQQVDTQIATVNQAEGAVKSDQGQIDSAQLNLTYSRITAPVSGRIGLRLVDAGNIVHATDQNGLLVITQLDPIAVVFTIAEDSLPQVLRRMRDGGRLEVDAYDREMKTKLASGTLLTVDNQIDQTTGTVKLKAVFSNKDTALFPNQFVNARLLVDTIRDTVIIPSAALQRSPQSTFVYVVKPDSTVETRNVEIRLSEADRTAILRGVSAGEVVVTDGVDKLQPGTKVAARKADAPDGQKTPSQ